MRLLICSLFCSGAVFAATPSPIPAKPVLKLQPELSQIVADDASLEVLAEGFRWAEGPVAEPGTGDILFSDVPANQVWRWNEQAGLSLYLSPSGYTQLDQAPNLAQGANGLIFNHQQQLVLAQHGDRRLAILQGIVAGQPHYQTLSSHYLQQQLNSPNDLVQHSDQSYFFTDPPYGLRDGDQSAQKQLKFNGVFRLDPQGQLQLLSDQLTRPNGLALSPDQQWLYVANSDPAAAQWWRFPLAADGSSTGAAELLLDATPQVKTRPGLPDGLKVLPSGHLLATGPGGGWIISASGQHLGTIQTGVAAANVALSLDRRYLYITATNYLLRIKLMPTTTALPAISLQK